MADGVAITAGSGTTILTDETATGHAQVVKLAIATDASATLIPADADGLLVNLGTNNDVTGTVTANAGTNLNTSALALETGGNLAASATSLALLDDAVIADDAAFTPATTKVQMAGYFADDTSTDVVTEGDGGAARITLDRRQIVQLGESGAKYVKGGGTKTDTSAQSLMAASGDAATSNYLCWVTVYNSSATNTAVEIRDGTTTVVAVIPAPAYGGATFVPTYPIKMTANTATNAYSKASVTSIEVYGGGYTTV